MCCRCECTSKRSMLRSCMLKVSFAYTDKLPLSNIRSFFARYAFSTRWGTLSPPTPRGIVGWKVGGQQVAVFRQTAGNFRQKRLWVPKISILPIDFPKMFFSQKLFIFGRKVADKCPLNPVIYLRQTLVFGNVLVMPHFCASAHSIGGSIIVSV